MIPGVVDSTVIIHRLRGLQAAAEWIETQPERLAVSSITWLEIMVGAQGKAGQERAKAILAQFTMLYLTDADQMWAMEQIEKYRLSHGVHINDCLIASVCYRLNVPLYTHNQKDFLKILPSTLVIKPY